MNEGYGASPRGVSACARQRQLVGVGQARSGRPDLCCSVPKREGVNRSRSPKEGGRVPARVWDSAECDRHFTLAAWHGEQDLEPDLEPLHGVAASSRSAWR